MAGFTKAFSEVDAGSTRTQTVRSSVLTEIRIGETIIGRAQSIRLSEDYAQQLLKELGSRTGVEFVSGIATGNGSLSRIWTKNKSFKKLVAEAMGIPWKTITVDQFPEMELTISDASDGSVLASLIGVAIMNMGSSWSVGNNFITQDVSFGFIDNLEGDG